MMDLCFLGITAGLDEAVFVVLINIEIIVYPRPQYFFSMWREFVLYGSLMVSFSKTSNVNFSLGLAFTFVEGGFFTCIKLSVFMD